MINEADITRRFKNLISTAQLVKKIGQHGYQGEYTEQAIYKLLDKYGIKAKTTRGGKSYFNKKNACTCIDRHIFELKEIAEELAQQNQPQEQEEPEWNVGYGRDDMSVASREQLANDGVFGSDENELYTNENIFSFKNIVNEALILNENEGCFKVCGHTETADLSDIMSTFHFKDERTGRFEETIKLLALAADPRRYHYLDKPSFGKPIYSFIVDCCHPQGLEIHTLTANSFLFCQNKKSKELITFWPPTQGQIKRYWTNLGEPVPNDAAYERIFDLSEKNWTVIRNHNLKIRCD